MLVIFFWFKYDFSIMVVLRLDQKIKEFQYLQTFSLWVFFYVFNNKWIWIMKGIIAIGLLGLSSFAFAYQNPTKEGECFFVDGAKQSYACMILSGGDVGVSYIDLQFNKQEYLIEQSVACGGKCVPHLGTIPEDVREAKKYFRNYKTKNIVANQAKGDWTCYKQNKGKLDVCYISNW